MSGKTAAIGLGIASAIVAMIGLGLSSIGVLLAFSERWVLGVVLIATGTVLLVGGVLAFLTGIALVAARKNPQLEMPEKFTE